jgi:hypothetical protein
MIRGISPFHSLFLLVTPKMPRLDLLAKVCARNTLLFICIIVVFLMFSEMRNRAYLDEYVARNRDIMQMYLHSTKICRKSTHNHSRIPEVAQEVIRDLPKRDPGEHILQSSSTTTPPEPDIANLANLANLANKDNISGNNVVNRSEEGFDYEMMDINNSDPLGHAGGIEVLVNNRAEVEEGRARGEMYQLASNNARVEPGEVQWGTTSDKTKKSCHKSTDYYQAYNAKLIFNVHD